MLDKMTPMQADHRPSGHHGSIPSMKRHSFLPGAAVAAIALIALPFGAQAAVPALAGLGAASVSPTPAHDSGDVVAAIEAFHAALAHGDSAAAMGMLAPDAVILETGGAETLEEYRSHHLPGDMAYAKATQRTRGPVRVTVRGDVAWASSTSTTTGEWRGKPASSRGAELVVLTRTTDGWRIAAIHWSSRAQRPAAG